MSLKFSRKEVIGLVVLSIIGLIVFALVGRWHRTPAIHGVVLDAETKEPVAGAWVYTSAGTYHETIFGWVTENYTLNEPFMRSDENGRFHAPVRRIRKAGPVLTWGSKVTYLVAGARTMDGRSGEVAYYARGAKHFWKEDGDVKPLLKKRSIELTVYVEGTEKRYERLYREKGYEGKELEERVESEMGSYISGMVGCTVRRWGFMRTWRESDCEPWQFEFAIAAHKRYLERYKDPKLIEDPPDGISQFDAILRYSRIQAGLAALYIKAQDYKRALNMYRQAIEFDKKHGLSLSLNDYERQIKKIEEHLKKEQP